MNEVVDSNRLVCWISIEKRACIFSVLGVQAQRGRVLSATVDKPGDAPVVVTSDHFWRNRLNSSADAVGQVLRLNGHGQS
jgi:hypothetical protein